MAIKGISIELINLIHNGVDEFNCPLFIESQPITVNNVLFAPMSSDDMTSGTTLIHDKERYQLAIPKGDLNDWTNAIVLINGKKFKTVGIPSEGIDELIPLDWNKKVVIERYE